MVASMIHSDPDSEGTLALDVEAAAPAAPEEVEKILASSLSELDDGKKRFPQGRLPNNLT